MTSTVIPEMPSWLSIAIKELGTSELSGSSKNNPRIIDYHSTTTLKASTDEIAWCSSFVNWCMKQAGFDYTRSAAARSWLKYGTALNRPAFGCITILSRGSDPSSGHVGFLTYNGADKIMLLGGNQNDKVSLASYPKSKVLGYRWP